MLIISSLPLSSPTAPPPSRGRGLNTAAPAAATTLGPKVRRPPSTQPAAVRRLQPSGPQAPSTFPSEPFSTTL